MTLRVLQVLEALEGGTARHLVDVVRHTKGVEHVVAIPKERPGWVTDQTAAGAIREAGADIHYLDMRRLPPHPRNATALIGLRRLIGTVRPAVVHGHSSVGGALARLAALHSSAARVYTPNGLARERAAVAIERALGRLTDRLVAVSASEGELVVELGIVPRQRVAVVPNGIETSLAEPPSADLRALIGVPTTTPLVGCVGRLVSQKAPEIYVRACAIAGQQVTDAHFVLVGSGPQLALVQSELQSAGLGDRFHHIPHVERSSTVLGQLDVYVLASRFEGGPYTPLEAMRAGTPVIVSNVVGNRDAVEHERSGIVVPPEDPSALAAAIVRVLRDPELRARLGAAGPDRVRAAFDVTDMGKALQRLYEEVAVEGAGRSPAIRRRT